MSCSPTCAALRGAALTWEPRPLRGAAGRGGGEPPASAPPGRARLGTDSSGPLPLAAATLTEKPPKYNTIWISAPPGPPSSRVPAKTRHTLGTGKESREAAFQLRISADCTVQPDKVLLFHLDAKKSI